MVCGRIGIDVAQLEAGAFLADEAGVAAAVEDGATVADAGAAAHLRLQQRLHGLRAPHAAARRGALLGAYDVGEGHEHGIGAADEDAIGPLEVVEEHVGDEALAPHGAVLGGDGDLDLAGHELGREHAGAVARAVEDHDALAPGDGLVGQPEQGRDADAAAHEQEVLAGVAQGVAAPERPPGVHEVAGLAPREPGRAAPDHVVENRELPAGVGLTHAVVAHGARQQGVVGERSGGGRHVRPCDEVGGTQHEELAGCGA